MRPKDKFNKKKIQSEGLVVLSNILDKNTRREAKFQNLEAIYWNFSTQAPMTLFTVHHRMIRGNN